MFLSIVVPVYKSKDSILPLYEEIRKQLTQHTHEIIFVDDCSPENEWNILSSLIQKDSAVKCIRLSRNFGQHAAILAGITKTIGDFVIIMDCDLQHDPKYIPQMLDLAKKGHDVVYTFTQKRKHSSLKNLFGFIFHKMFNYLAESNIESHKSVGSYTLLSKKVVQSYISLSDQKRHHLFILRWLGYKSTYLPIDHKPRYSGKSSYSFKKLLIHALDGITAHSKKLLWLSIFVGFIFCICSFSFAIVIFYKWFTEGTLMGWTSTMLTLIFCTGTVLTGIGIQGIYIGNIYDETRKRPLYIIDQKLGFD